MTTSGHIPVNGARIYFEAAGNPSAPALLFIHAGVADSRMWDAQIEHFSLRYRVVRYDTRGYGQTTMEDVEFTNHADAIAVLDHLGIAKAVLIGCSRGGAIAMGTTLYAPRRVRGLVMVASAPSGFDYQPPDTELARIISGLFEQMEAAEQARDWEKVAALDVRLWGDGPAQPEGRMAAPLREKMYAMCLHAYRNHTTDGKPQPLQPPAIGRLNEIAVPTLIVEGEFDLPSMAAAAEVMGHGIPHAQHVVISGAAHLPSMEQPTMFNQALDDFLRRNNL